MDTGGLNDTPERKQTNNVLSNSCGGVYRPFRPSLFSCHGVKELLIFVVFTPCCVCREPELSRKTLSLAIESTSLSFGREHSLRNFVGGSSREVMISNGTYSSLAVDPSFEPNLEVLSVEGIPLVVSQILESSHVSCDLSLQTQS